MAPRWPPRALLAAALLVLALGAARPIASGRAAAAREPPRLYVSEAPVPLDGRLVRLDPDTLADRPDLPALEPDGSFWALSADGATLVSLGSAWNLERTTVGDARSGAERNRYPPPPPVRGVRLSADGARLVLQRVGPTGVPAPAWDVLETASGRLLAAVKAEAAADDGWQSLIDPAGRRLYRLPLSESTERTGPQPLRIVAHDLTTGAEIGRLELPGVLAGSWRTERTVRGEPVRGVLHPGVALSPDGRTLAIVHADADRVTLVDAARLAVGRTVDLTRAVTLLERLGLTPRTAYAKGPLDGAVREAVFGPDGRRLYVFGHETRAAETGDPDAGAGRGLGLQLVDLARGAVVAEGYWEPYGAGHRHMLFSVAKSFASAAIGLLVAEGRLSVDDPVLGFFPDEAPAGPSDNLRRMRVRHLLTMTTGLESDPTRLMRRSGQAWAQVFLAQPVVHAPGARFLYSDAASYMLSALAQRVTGQRLVHYLGPRLFGPLGIGDPSWETSPEGVDVGGWGLSLTALEVARFGQLHLQGGVWGGRRLLPEAWVAEATSRRVPSGPPGVPAEPDYVQGYGYQFWRCRHGAYRGDGAFGQFCVVMPDQEAVLAVTAGVGLSQHQRLLDLVWRHLLAAMGTAPLPDDPAARDALRDRLAVLRLPTPAGQPASPLAAGLSGRAFSLAENPDGIEALRFDVAPAGSTLTVRAGRGEHGIPCAHGCWSRGEAPVPPTMLRASEAVVDDGSPAKVAASGAWADEDTYVVGLRWYETAFGRTLTCRFAGDRVSVEQEQNTSFGPTGRTRLEGVRAT
jgi:CubicO group peptidase (beta-lactamase class C family)